MLEELRQELEDLAIEVVESDPLDLQTDYLLEMANVKHSQFKGSLTSAIYFAKESGELLLRAKAEYQRVHGKRGGWTEKLKREFEGGLSTAYNHMKLAEPENWQRVSAYFHQMEIEEQREMGVKQALALLSEAVKEPEPESDPVSEPEPAPESEVISAEDAADRYWRLHHKSPRGRSAEDKAWMREYEKTSEGKAVKQALTRAESSAPRTGALSSANPSNELYTPMEWVERIEAFLGRIDLDPAADPGKRIPARMHYTQAENGLEQPWAVKVFLNPPYNPVDGVGLLQWVGKINAEFDAGRTRELLLLVPAYTAEGWYQMLEGEWMVLAIRGRLRFEGADGPARFSSLLMYRGERGAEFELMAGDYGRVLAM